MRRLALSALLLALLGAACVEAPPRATSPACHDDSPEPGLCSPLRRPA